MDHSILNQILVEVKGVKTEVASLKADVNGLKAGMNSLKGEVKELKTEQEKTNDRLSSIESKQNLIYEQTGTLSDFRTETLSRLDKLVSKGDLAYYDKKISEHDREIFNIKTSS